MTDDEFLHAFETGRLHRREWTHAAHLRMAYLYLRGRTVAEALPIIRAGVQHFNASKGNFTGYNETLTVAFTEIVACRLQRVPSPTYQDFERDNSDLFSEGMGILTRYYSEPIYFREEAKATFLPPDLARFETI